VQDTGFQVDVTPLEREPFLGPQAGARDEDRKGRPRRVQFEREQAALLGARRRSGLAGLLKLIDLGHAA